jgi:hypothetical protein
VLLEPHYAFVRCHAGDMSAENASAELSSMLSTQHAQRAVANPHLGGCAAGQVPTRLMHRQGNAKKQSKHGDCGNRRPQTRLNELPHKVNLTAAPPTAGLSPIDRAVRQKCSLTNCAMCSTACEMRIGSFVDGQLRQARCPLHAAAVASRGHPRLPIEIKPTS